MDRGCPFRGLEACIPYCGVYDCEEDQCGLLSLTVDLRGVQLNISDIDDTLTAILGVLQRSD